MNNKKTMALLKNGQLKFIIINDTLEEYYKVLECDLIETLNINIKYQNYTLIFDESGKLKENYINLGFINKQCKLIDYIAGHIIIQKYDYEKQEVINLNEDDINHLKQLYENCTKLLDFENARYIPTIQIN